MKNLIVLMLVLIFPMICFSGCNEKRFDYQLLQRDSYNTGGNLSFVYDSQSHTAHFGGEDEFVQFYDEDIAKGWTEKGCRIGVMLTIPKGLNDFKSGYALIGKEKYNSDDFIQKYYQYS